MVKYRETDDEAADKLDLAMGYLLRAEQVAKQAADMKKAAKEYMKNVGLSEGAVAYALKHRAAKPDLIASLREDEDNDRREREHYLEVARARMTPIEKLIARAAAGPANPPHDGGGAAVIPMHPPGRA